MCSCARAMCVAEVCTLMLYANAWLPSEPHLLEMKNMCFLTDILGNLKVNIFIRSLPIL